jgi:hypothetical protein
LNSSFFQYAAANSTETDAFDWSASQTTWLPVAVTKTSAISYLNFTANDSAEIDISVTVPANEPQGTKSSTIIFEAEYSG